MSSKHSLQLDLDLVLSLDRVRVHAVLAEEEDSAAAAVVHTVEVVAGRPFPSFTSRI